MPLSDQFAPVAKVEAATRLTLLLPSMTSTSSVPAPVARPVSARLGARTAPEALTLVSTVPALSCNSRRLALCEAAACTMTPFCAAVGLTRKRASTVYEPMERLGVKIRSFVPPKTICPRAPLAAMKNESSPP